MSIGDYGSNNDSGVLEKSKLGEAFSHNKLHIPPNEAVRWSEKPMPYYLVGDDIFGLQMWLQRPYPGISSEEKRIFNYRLSRARRVIENAFGIMVARWRIFSHPIQASVETAEAITKAAICLHNFLRLTNSAVYCPKGFVDSTDSSGNIKPGEWRSIALEANGAIRNLLPLRGRRYKTTAIEVREILTNYLNSDAGSVPWQWDHVRSRGTIRKRL